MNDGCREGRGRREGRKTTVKLGFSEVDKDWNLIQLLSIFSAFIEWDLEENEVQKGSVLNHNFIKATFH